MQQSHEVDYQILGDDMQIVEYDIQRAGNLFGGEGLFLATLSGTGVVMLQSLPFSRLADRILQSASFVGGSRKGESSLGSSLGGAILGSILDND